jgi:hypothetical protein
MKSLTFLAPIHWLNTLAPVVSALEARGVHNTYVTANAEAAFEHGLAQRLDTNWEFLPLYNDEKRQERHYTETIAYFRELYTKPSPVSFLVPPVADRIIREVCNDTWAFKRILDQQKPDLCLVLHELGRWGCIFGYWCQQKHIPFWSVQEGCYYGDPRIYAGHTRYSTSLVWGEATKRKLLAAGCPAEKLIVTGHPGLKARWDDAEAKRAEALALLPPHFAGKKYAALYITNINLQHIDVPALVEGLAASDYRLIVRIAVMGTVPLIQKVQELFKGYEHLVYVSPPINDLALPLLNLAEVIAVLGCSTVTLECLWKGKPTAEVFTPGVPYSFLQAGVVGDASNPHTALAWIEATQALFATDAHQDKVRAYVQDEICDGDAAGNMADIMLRR